MKYDISPDFHLWMEERGFKTHSFEIGGYWYGETPEGRQIRVIRDGGVIQICDGEFDRWANSVGAEVNLDPWTEKGLDRSLKKLYEVVNLR